MTAMANVGILVITVRPGRTRCPSSALPPPRADTCVVMAAAAVVVVMVMVQTDDGENKREDA